MEQIALVEQVLEMPDVEAMEQGVLYVSQEYGIAAHICPCGCDGAVFTPTAGDRLKRWDLTDGESGVSLNPSILNTWCGAHYFIRNSRIVWA